jgi:hypothetical protein
MSPYSAYYQRSARGKTSEHSHYSIHELGVVRIEETSSSVYSLTR